MNLFRLVAKLALDTNEYEKGIGESSEKTKSFASRLGGGLKTAAGIGMAAVGAAASGITALAGAAVNNYAEYEQLVGGIDTLFEDLGYDVQLNAKEAFRTAGMSASEYMDTVMGFSASLNQSLIKSEGNIARAADVADQTIIDMSDNANKMGTDMESIQYAYQGFAKQNFTMLDNLKLGYGGTQEEMQRLLDDAEKLSGVEYDISSFADIAEAIHVVQTEMGITGTTAKEASETISGSVGSMKAAWTNLVTGLADDEADFEKLVDDFAGSVIAVGKNLLPRIKTSVKGVGKLFDKFATELLPMIIDTIVADLPSIVQTGTNVLVKLIVGLVKAIPQLVQAIPQIIDAIIDGFRSADVDWINIGKDVVRGVWEGLTSMGGWLWENVKGFFGNVVGWAKDVLGIHSPSKVFAGIGKYMAEGVGVGFGDGFGKVKKTVNDSLSFSAGIISADFVGSVGASTSGSTGGVVGLLEAILGRLEHLYIRMDSGELVGVVDYQLGKNSVGEERGLA